MGCTQKERPPALPQAAPASGTLKADSDSEVMLGGSLPHTLSKMIAISGSIERRETSGI